MSYEELLNELKAHGTSSVRWIIDYKTSVHEGGNIETFLDEEMKRYRGQLMGYVSAFAGLEERETKAALYYPLIDGGWRELE